MSTDREEEQSSHPSHIDLAKLELQSRVGLEEARAKEYRYSRIRIWREVFFGLFASIVGAFASVFVSYYGSLVAEDGAGDQFLEIPSEIVQVVFAAFAGVLGISSIFLFIWLRRKYQQEKQEALLRAVTAQEHDLFERVSRGVAQVIRPGSPL